MCLDMPVLRLIAALAVLLLLAFASAVTVNMVLSTPVETWSGTQ